MCKSRENNSKSTLGITIKNMGQNVLKKTAGKYLTYFIKEGGTFQSSSFKD